RANAHVATKCKPDATADTVAADHCDGRFGKIVERIVRTIDRGVVAVDAFLGRTFLFEFGNVSARDEGLATGAGDDDNANVLVVLEFLEKTRRCLPHLQRNSIVALRIVEGQIADLAFLAREHLISLSHQLAPSSSLRHGRARPGHSVLARFKLMDARHYAGHDTWRVIPPWRSAVRQFHSPQNQIP